MPIPLGPRRVSNAGRTYLLSGVVVVVVLWAVGMIGPVVDEEYRVSPDIT
jgi:hypothetical protein